MRDRGGTLVEVGGNTGMIGGGGADAREGAIVSVLGVVVKGAIGLGSSMCDG